MIKSAVIFIFLSIASFKLYSRYISIVIDKADESYDFIIVGGGTTGAVVAARLSEIENFRVLVLEAGSEENYDPRINVPLLFPLSLGTAQDWQYKTKTKFSKNKKNDVEDLPRGKILGGTSNMNFQLYVRGSEEDYDAWANNGAADWNYGRIKRYFIKSEKSNHKYDIDKEYHGTDGPLEVGHLQKMPITDVFLNATQELGLPYGDVNGKTSLGAAVAQTTVKNGLRQSSVKAYLSPVAHERRDRLHIVTDAHVTKILFRGVDNGRNQAVGVQYEKNGKKLTVRASREVILSAGVYGTPHILMLSGVGPKEHLENKGVPVFQDLPGVGSNLQDHPFIPIAFYSKNLSFGDVASTKEIIYSLPSYLTKGTGPLGCDGVALATVPLSDSEPQDRKYRRHRVFQLLLMPVQSDVMLHKMLQPVSPHKDGAFDKVYEKANNERDGVVYSYFILTSIMNTRSRGIVRLNTTNPFDHPFINHRMYSDPKDLKDIVEGVKWTIDLTKTEAFKKLEPELVDLYGGCETAKEKGLDEFYKCIVSAGTQLYHGCCTAKIGSIGDKFAVVDPQLRVYGIDGLRIADASVMPSHVSAPPQATCYMIGEKAADLIKETWSV